MKKNKALKVLATSAMLASVAAPFAAPVSANSSNLVDKVLKVSSNYDSTTAGANYNNLIVQEDDIAFTTNDTFRVTLPSGVEWDNETDLDVATPNATIVKRSAQVIEVTPTTLTPGTDDIIKVPMMVKVNGATGELKARIDAMDSTITGGDYTFAVIGSGNTTAVAETVETIGGTGKGGVIRIEENALDAIPNGTKTVTLKLPSNYTWTNETTVSASGGFANAVIKSGTTGNSNTLTLEVDAVSTGGRGTLYVTPGIKAGKDAGYGDITVNVSGTDFSDSDVVVAKYADWGVNAKIEAVNEVLAGKFDENTKTAKITIEESVPGSFIADRDIDVELPSWVKVTGIKETTYSGFSGAAPSAEQIDGKDNEFSFTVNSKGGNTSKAKIEFKLELSVEGDKTGDIEAIIGGAGVPEQKLVIAKAVAPVTAAIEGEASKVKIGAQSQDAPNLIITETKKGALEKQTEAGNSNGTIEVDLPDGVTFASVPTVAVVEGDGAVDVNNVKRINNNNTLSIPVKSESIKPVKIKLSNIKLTVDRTVPEGQIEAKVGGDAVVENSRSAQGWLSSAKAGGNSNDLDAGEFNTGSAAKVVLANTITPAPGETTAQNVVFKIGQKSYTVNGETREMDVAPYVHAVYNRTYVPVSHVAASLNVAPEKVVWNEAAKTVTVFSGSTVISATAGKKEIVVNGTAIPTDAPVMYGQHTGYRVMVPYTHFAVAMGAKVEWKADTQEVIINK
ncbi:copper amine oxidase N-terminal domain-containing protein [Aneurinibacillus sp. REN35]|uniref:copper amine oxidase N-terminal domain-containing protein n=1 Tax=Aneurinibacillus sp. REN35 TaxID=3237286 RepID=UPI0035291776